MAELYFGGSFNPIHNGHLQCSIAAATAGGFEGVVLVPTGQPALKINSEIAPAADRLAMAEIAARAAARASTQSADATIRIRVDAIEVLRPGTSYTVDTAAALRGNGARKIDWLIGADQLLNLHRWHRYADLMQGVQFWVMARPGYVIDWGAVDPLARRLSDFVLPAPLVDISATMLRDRVRRGYSVDEWVPPGVAAYIREHSLYIQTPRQTILAD